MTAEMRTRMWVSLFVLVVFLAGLGAGIVAAPWLALGPRPGFGPGRGNPPVPPMSGRVLERMDSRLDMSGEQSERLSALFDARRERFRSIGRDMRRDMRARFAAEQETFRAAIAEILTPAQMALFDAEIARMGEERRRRPGSRDRRERGRRRQ
jgi:Spy/CpxP family protein refolding chaperone